MNWINIRTETLRSPAFVRAKPGAIETWLKVLAYCCEQENDGMILDGVAWTDRGWMTACGVSREEVIAASPLIYDDGVAVFVDGFPSEKQAEIQAKRKAGSKGGRRSARSRASSCASPDRRTEGEGEGNRKEKRNGNQEKEKEGNSNTNNHSASPSVSEFEEFWAAYPRKVGKGDAEKAWVKHGCSKLLPQIMTVVRKCKISADWTKDAGQFIPHPATWLNRHGWDDELLPGQNGNARGSITENIVPHIIEP